MSYEDILKRRSLGFLRNAKDNFERGEYDLSIFHVEQAIQLYLKFLLYKKVGVYPKTHSLTGLFKEIIKVFDREDIKKFFDQNFEMINLLEDAYITSRYLPREYDKELAERILRFAERAMEVMECLEKP